MCMTGIKNVKTGGKTSLINCPTVSARLGKGFWEKAIPNGSGSSALSRFVTRLLVRVNLGLTNKLDCPRDLFQYIHKRLLPLKSRNQRLSPDS
jgi:hypothetical protein